MLGSGSTSALRLAICNLRSKNLDYRLLPGRGGVNRRKRTATASPANDDFAKAYCELVRLERDDFSSNRHPALVL